VIDFHNHYSPISSFHSPGLSRIKSAINLKQASSSSTSTSTRVTAGSRQARGMCNSHRSRASGCRTAARQHCTYRRGTGLSTLWSGGSRVRRCGPCSPDSRSLHAEQRCSFARAVCVRAPRFRHRRQGLSLWVCRDAQQTVSGFFNGGLYETIPHERH
jgi:hypothetical protein